MKNKLRLLAAILVSFAFVQLNAQKPNILKSPDGKLQVTINLSRTLDYSLAHDGDAILDKSPISITLIDGKTYGIEPKLKKATPKTVNQTIDATIYKKKKITDNYNELTMEFGEYNVIFRAYNDGMAYRFESLSKKSLFVQSEEATFNFPSEELNAYIAYANSSFTNINEQFSCSFENTYAHNKLSEWDKKRIAFLPIVVEAAKGKKVCITESDLLNYPGMFLRNAMSTKTLKGEFAPYPTNIKQGGHNMLQGLVTSRETYIAKYDAGTKLPWRAVIVAEKDYDLANSDMVYKLASPSQIADQSWIKPGKVAWDWWNDWNVYGVDFRAGINNDTYKYYIDFASENGVEYVILDEGWAVNLKNDLMQVVPEINLKELVDYAKNKKVGIILWAGYNAFNSDIEGVCKHYSEMGVKGFKVDFMDRDDQLMVDFHHRAAQIAAKYKMLLDFHGTYKPTGLQRTYPNVINFEGVYGLEQLKWGSQDQVTYDVTMPFIRMVAGPVDYTQGAMRNATKDNFRSVNSEAMSQGTRCHQLAEYVVFESPLNMLCDNPSNYMREKECTEYIATIPTTWDETVAVNGEIGKYISLARRKASEWYVGSINNWDARTLELDLSFLGEGKFRAEIFKDGINADRAARDYKKERIDIPANRKLSISLAPGGGYAMRIFRSN